MSPIAWETLTHRNPCDPHASSKVKFSFSWARILVKWTQCLMHHSSIFMSPVWKIQHQHFRPRGRSSRPSPRLGPIPTSRRGRKECRVGGGQAVTQAGRHMDYISRHEWVSGQIYSSSVDNILSEWECFDVIDDRLSGDIGCTEDNLLNSSKCKFLQLTLLAYPPMQWISRRLRPSPGKFESRRIADSYTVARGEREERSN